VLRYEIVVATCSYFGIISYGQKGVKTVSWEMDCMGSRGLLNSFSDEAGLGTDQSWMKRNSENERMVQTSPVMEQKPLPAALEHNAASKCKV
jgi:hypothetical protein